MNEQIEIQPSQETEVDSVIKKRKILYSMVKGMELIEVGDRIANRLNELEKKYPDARKYYLFHVLAGSTIDRAVCYPEPDFPEHEVEKLVDDLYSEYQTDEQK